MLNQEQRTVNTLDSTGIKDEEIMIPYPRVAFIVWDKEAGKRIKEMRNAKDLSLERLAELTNGVVSRDTIQSLELGRMKSVSREKLDALLGGLGCDVRSLFPSVTVRMQ